MKKYFLFVMAVLAGLFTSCKEEMAPALVEGDTNVTIKVQAPQQNLGTRSGATAFADPALSDMRVALIISTTDNQVVTVTTKTHSFGTGSTACTFDARLYKGKTYNISVWADYGSTYYTIPTQPETKEAAAATKPVIKMASLSIDSCINKYDAYFGNVTTALSDNGDINVSLKRPFALVKVNTADWNENAVKLANYRPDHYATTFSAPTQLDLVSGVADSVKNIAVAAAIVAYDADAATKELHYNYLFANEASSILPKFTVDYKQGSTTNSDYEFENIPVQRNYKTNITGNILTKNGKIKVTVDPLWLGGHVCDIAGANEIIEANKEADIIDVEFTSEPNDAGVPGAQSEGITALAIVTTPVKEGAVLNIKVGSETKSLYVGDYNDAKDVTAGVSADADSAIVNINVPQGSSIGTLVINAPSKTVYINGQLVSNTGVINNIDAITSMNTLVIEKNQHIGTLTIRQGGLEIHGVVDHAVIPEGHGAIEVRDCENLLETEVYNVLKDYIAIGYIGVKGLSTEGLWDIVPARCKIGNDKYYYTLLDAVTAVQEGETISLLKDIKGSGVIVPGGKNFTIDFGGYTYEVDGNLAGSEGTKSQCFQLLSGSTIIFKNGEIKTNIASIGINNYANLTLRDMTIDMRETSKTGQVSALQVMNGNAEILGNTNIYAKENPGATDAFVAILSLYWPTSYGDIDINVNTTGVVKGLLAYASYECSDLTTVKDHAHFAIKGGKYDVTYDMDGLTTTDFKISGGLFKAKPADEYLATNHAAVASEDANYPWKVQFDMAKAEVSIAKTGETTVYTTLAAFRDATNAGNTYAGYTITLLKDIDLNNVEWTPISNYAYGAGSDKLFAGTFDGDNHTISNLKISANSKDALGNTSDIANGFFGQVATCTIKNVKFSNANVSGAGLNAIVASLHIVSSGKLLMKNVQVLSGSVTNTSNAGGLMCFVTGWSGFEDCVNYASVSGYGTGGIVGMLRDNSANNTCTIDNCTNYGTITNTVGGGDGAGGIVSKINNSGSITNCKNYGVISGTVGNVYAGGIIGVANPNYKTFTISNCINYAAISSNAGEYGRAGGILGSFGGSLTISKCINMGNITGYQGAGGINGWNGNSWDLVDEYCYNSGIVTCSNGTNAGGIEQGNINQTVKYSLNNGAVTCANGTAWQISNSTSTITSCYYYDGAALKDKDSTAVDNIDAAVSALNTNLATPFWGKDGDVIKPIALIQ